MQNNCLVIKRTKDFYETFGMAFKHKNFNKNLFETVKKQDQDKVLNLATPQARKLYGLHIEVCTSIHLKKGFIRFNMSKRGILFTKTKLEHDVEEDLLDHFHERFPLFYIVIESKHKVFCVNTKGFMTVETAKLSDVVERLEKNLPIMEMFSESDFTQDLWETYYSSQFVSERRNIKLMKKMMPLKHRDEGMIETNMSKKSKKITDFMT